MPVAVDRGIPNHPPFRGATFELSALAFTVPAPTRGSADHTLLARLRRARAEGITTFDVAASPDPAAAEAVLARAFPSEDLSLVVIASDVRTHAGGPVAPRDWRPGAPPRSGALAGGSAATWKRFRSVLLERPADLRGDPAPADGDGTADPRPVRVPVARCDGRRDVERAAEWPAPRLLSGAFSILEPEPARTARRMFASNDLSWIARDPWAGGRLDGTRFLRTPAGLLGSPPATLRDMEDGLRAIAPLDFLARRGSRTLAQASLRYLTDLPWVATVVVPLPSAERWPEVLGFARAPALTDEDRRRIETIGSRPAAAPSEAGATP